MKDIDEAIKHCKEVAAENEYDAKEYNRLAKLETYPSRKECESAYKRCRKCAEEHRQLAEWLKELKKRREQPEIIRCKDCKYWTHIKRTNRYWCKTDDGLFDLNPSPDDFCSRAERRNNG